MIDQPRNPFVLTSANDLDNELISRYWVQFPGGKSFFRKVVDPTSPRPMLIRGGKGSGKTHLMRYLSFPLQQIRYKDNVLKGILSDGYLGLYFRCGPINAFRFWGKGISQEEWEGRFAYFMELWFAELLLTTVEIAFKDLPLYEQMQPVICGEIANLFDEFTIDIPSTFANMIKVLQQLQKQVNLSVNNRSSGADFEFKVIVTPGRLTSEIPKLFASHFDELKNLQFLYLIDELENLREYQQSYIQTLIRGREKPVTFYVGTRLYGVKTYKILGSNEENKAGSEFHLVELDAELRKKGAGYSKFVKALCMKRLAEAGYVHVDVGEALNSQSDEERIRDFRKEFKETLPPYFLRLQSQLERQFLSNGILTNSQINSIITNLLCPQDAIAEKANIFLLYQDWWKKKPLLLASENIRLGCEKYLSGEINSTPQSRILNKYRADLIAQAYEDFEKKQPYCGLETYIPMTEGLPRHLLIILQKIFNWAMFYGEKPFLSSLPISERAQTNGAKEAAEWFLVDSTVSAEQAHRMGRAIKRLGNFFRAVRYSDKPSECSLITFSYDQATTKEEVLLLIEECVRWSLLIRIPGGQKYKNSTSKLEKLQINRMLSPYWGLPTGRRGTIPLSPDAVQVIFGDSEDRDFDEFEKSRLLGMKAPFGINKSRKQSPIHMAPSTLFEDAIH